MLLVYCGGIKQYVNIDPAVNKWNIGAHIIIWESICQNANKHYVYLDVFRYILKIFICIFKIPYGVFNL